MLSTSTDSNIITIECIQFCILIVSYTGEGFKVLLLQNKTGRIQLQINRLSSNLTFLSLILDNIVLSQEELEFIFLSFFPFSLMLFTCYFHFFIKSIEASPLFSMICKQGNILGSCAKVCINLCRLLIYFIFFSNKEM